MFAARSTAAPLGRDEAQALHTMLVFFRVRLISLIVRW